MSGKFIRDLDVARLCFEEPTARSTEHQKTGDMELVIDAVLDAQRLFKQEFDEKWATLQSAMIPLQVELQSLRQYGSQEGIRQSMPTPTESGIPMAENSAVDILCNEQVSEANGISTDKALHELMRNPVYRSRSELCDVGGEIMALERAEAAERARDEASQMKQGPRWQRLLRSRQFETANGGLIVANMLLLMLRVQYEGEKIEPGVERPRSSVIETVLSVFEHFFTAAFLLELILRLVAESVSYLRSVWNCLDGVVVVLGCLDTWVLPALTGGANARGFALLRVFKLLRLAKILRVVRVMKVFAPLRVLVQAIFGSFAALLWSLLLLILLEIMGAILLAQILAPVIDDETQNLQLRETIWSSYGTMLRSWLTLFEITMAPGGFLQHRYLFDDVNPVVSFVIAVYVFIVTFAIIRIITALFLKETLSASDEEHRRQMAHRRERRQEYAKRLCSSLEEELEQAHIDRNGLATLLTFRRFTDWLDDAALTMTDVTRLFKALDTGNGSVALEEFLGVISQISDSAHDRDAILHHESASLVNTIRQMSHGS